MTRKNDKGFATTGALKTAPGAHAACRDGSLMMHPTPGAVPSQAMIEALNPDYIAKTIAPEQWGLTAEALGCPDLAPEHAPEIVRLFIVHIPIEERARLVRDYVTEVFTLVAMAREIHPEISLDVLEEFPGLKETFEAASIHYGDAAMLRAIGFTIH